MANSSGSQDSWATSEATRRSMQSNRGRDTEPELRLRRILHSRGFRYRVDARPIRSLNRRADLLFPTEHLAVFVDGCFWHCCPIHYQAPASNPAYWQQKVDDNRRRDRQTDRLLRRNGWSVIRVWEHADPALAANRIERKVLACRIAISASGGVR